MSKKINLEGDQYDTIAGVLVAQWGLLGADQANASDAVAAALRTVAGTAEMLNSDASVIAEVASERRRQIEAEGWTPEHDDQHAGELAAAAGCYALHAAYGVSLPDWYRSSMQPNAWPWSPKWWKPKDKRRDLIRAAALIVAEIERIDRAEQVTEAAS